MSAQWFIRLGENDSGPLSTEQLKQLVDQGRMNRETPVRQGQDGAWVPAAWIPNLFAAFAPAPARTGLALGAPRVRPNVPGGRKLAPATAEVAVRVAARPDGNREPVRVSGHDAPRARGLLVWGVAGSTGVLVVGMALAALAWRNGLESVERAGQQPPTDSSPSASEAAKPVPDEKATAAPEKPTDVSNADEPEATPRPDPPPESSDHGEAPKTTKTRAKPASRSSREPGPPPERSDPGRTLTTEEIASRADPSVALISGKRSRATGFLIHDKLLISNHHVVQDELIGDLQVDFLRASESLHGPYAARLVYEDTHRDLAILAVETSLPPLKLAGIQAMPRAQRIVVIGNTAVGSGAGVNTLPNAISEGTMSAEVTIDGQIYWQTTVAGVGPGNSGGPVLNPKGEVIGIVAADLNDPEKPTQRRPGLNLCIPLPDLHEALSRCHSSSAEEIDQVAAKHEASVIYHFASRAGKDFVQLVHYYIKLGDNAWSDNKSVDTSLDKLANHAGDDDTRKAIEQLQARVKEHRADLDSRLRSAVSSISTDHRLADRIREDVSDLWSNIGELARLAEKSGSLGARNTWARQKEKLNEVVERHHRIVERARLDLGIE